MKTRYIVALLIGLFVFLQIAGLQALNRQLSLPDPAISGTEVPLVDPPQGTPIHFNDLQDVLIKSGFIEVSSADPLILHQSTAQACICTTDDLGRPVGATAEVAIELDNLRTLNAELEQRNTELHQQQGQFIMNEADGIGTFTCRITNRYELEICDKIAQNVWKDRKEDRK